MKESGAVNRWEHLTMEVIFAGWEMYIGLNMPVRGAGIVEHYLNSAI